MNMWVHNRKIAINLEDLMHSHNLCTVRIYILMY